MQRRKKGIIIASAVIVGILAIGGTVYGYTKNAETSIKNEQLSLSGIKSNLNKMVDKQGYLLSSATVSTLSKYKKSVEQLKDSYVDFHIKKDDLKNEVKVIKIGKREVLNKIHAIEKKLSEQNNVNALFTSDAINGTNVKKQPVNSKLTIAQVSKVKNSLDSKDDSAWMKSMQSLVNDASSQVKQIQKTSKMVASLYKNGKVSSGVSRSGYNTAMTEIKKVRNTEVKQLLFKKMKPVLAMVIKKEKIAEKSAKARLEAVKQQQSQQQGSQSAGTFSSRVSSNSNSGYSGGNSNSGYSGESNGNNSGTPYSSGSSYSGGSNSSGSSSYSGSSSHKSSYSVGVVVVEVRLRGVLVERVVSRQDQQLENGLKMVVV